MNKILLLTFSLISFSSFSQKIVENKIDDFTKKGIVRTDWENLSGMSSLHFSTRISKIDDKGYLNIKVFTQSVTSVTKDHDILLMAENGEILTLHSLEHVISGYGDGANGIVGSKVLGLHITCALAENDISFLKNNIIKKVRINSSNGYMEDDIKAKNGKKLQQMVLLVFNKK